jgi:dTDP-4-dehydrorhamnose 3,5-epimerase-like enzyme
MIEKFNEFIDERGSLFPFELEQIPFDVKRLFIVSNVPVNTTRGGHSHYKTKQLIVCTRGLVDVILHDGITEKTIKLESGQSILVPELIWDSQTFLSDNTEIIVFCSTNFDPNDYIHDFDFFKKIKNKNE